MSHTLAPATTEDRARGVTFGHVLASEWIKLVSVRSTYWTSAVIVVLWIGLALVLALDGGFGDPTGGAGGGPQPIAFARSATVTTTTIGLSFGVLVAGILGVLAVSGEYSTGMVRSSLVAVPTRVPVLLAKAVVVFAWTFLLGTVAVICSYAVGAGPLSSQGVLAAPDGPVLAALLGAPTFLGLVAVFGVGVGAIVRSAAGGIAITIGVLFVLPIVVSIGGAFVHWISSVGPYLLSSLGSAMTALPNASGESAGVGAGVATAVAALWAVVVLALGLVRFTQQDV